jgi:hypothetical protein
MEGARISAADLTRTLEPIVGKLARMVFHRGSAHEIGWAGVRPSGDVVSGTLALGASVADNMVTTWAEVRLDPPGSSIVVDPSDLRVIEPAATRAAERIAREYIRRGEGLVPVDENEDEPVGEDGKRKTPWELA